MSDLQVETSYEREHWPRRLLAGARARVRAARSFWRSRDCNTVAVVRFVHRGVIDDEPRLRSLIDRDLAHGLNNDRISPLGWRRTDARWALTNLRRAVRGQAPLPLPYDERTTLEMDESRRIEHNLVTLRAERRRTPRAQPSTRSGR